MTVSSPKMMQRKPDGGSKKRPLNIPQDSMNFLMLITKPAALDHEASHANFIRNAVLEEIRARIVTCDMNGGY